MGELVETMVVLRKMIKKEVSLGWRPPFTLKVCFYG